MKRLAILAMLGLAACGADGDPVRPDAPEPGITITGTAEIGVSG
ncbi:hypothetical protein [Tropicibacter naphthalenivorans]|uniref:Uncharacterized protein n=1 Tax=Tropicibacter naphthalenivorans TaxID=441103 RepID=A0A0P1GE22_9RHOB|nr:hypothetical protein [Tropicibacter naphthalenivorans]CUH79858.1 hypothetical protein TRN7648_02682 [Tropicibacter naphthalenivorans]SMC75709.1 hypothetical protein SAMN04488093_103313 [Tropicibacter naphthalenivorans]